MRNFRKLTVLCLVLVAAGLAAGALLSVKMRTTAAPQEPLVVSDTQPRRPSPQSVSRWLRASNDELAARAADYRLDAPRRRNEQGQALPFREKPWPAAQLRALEDVKQGDEIVLELFDDVSFRVRVTGRWEDADGFRLAARLEGMAPKDRFFMSWGGNRGRGLVELPSINRAYEIVRSATGAPLVLEWLYTDVVCATPAGAGADAGLPTPASPVLASAPRIAAGAVPPLESRPGAVAVIYLDFDGEVVSGTAWASGATINAPAARMDAAQITETWERVSRDFAPFNVNVTTIRSVYDAAPGNRRTHCVVTEDDTAASGAGGVAYLDSFANADPAYKICWSFIDNNARNCAVVVSHEVGHTLDLEHDGRLASGSEPREEYYIGHGTGPTGWAPIMGVGYYQQLVQWSKGEYARANNQEDDLAIITASARIPYVNDDHSGTSAAATVLVSGAAANGLVDRNTDVDFFRVLIGSGPQPVTVSLPVGTMLDVVLNIFGEDGTLLDTVNPAGELAASTTLNFSTARNVFLAIAGTGKPQVLETGYSAYSSLGSYTLLAGTPLPQKVTGLVASPVSDSAVDLSWSAAPAAASYVVRRDGADITNTAATYFRNTGLSESTSYIYEIVATNGTGAAPASDPASATTLSWFAANPYGLRVTSPASLVATNATNFIFSGQMGAGLTGGIVAWTNVNRAASGYVTPLGTNWSQSIALLAGTNRIIFSTSYAKPISTNITAYDGAGDWNYQSQGWVAGANGGYGFGAWSNGVISSNASLAVTDSFAATNMNVNTFYGFSLRAGAGSFAIARRPFAAPLAVGSSFTVNFDSNLLDAGRTVGFSLADAGGTNRLTFFALGGTPNVYGIRDGAGTNTNTGIAYTTTGLLPVTFTMISSNSYRLVTGTNAPITNTLVAGGAISGLVASNSSAGGSIDNAFYLGDMSILSPVTSNQPVRVAAPFVVQPVSVSTDGIPNVWWETYFPGNTAAWVAANDSDSDGQSNAAEYTAGTSPVDASSKFAITSMVRAGNNTTITWSAVGGKIYSVESNVSLAGTNWQSVPPNVTNSSGATNLSTNVPIATPEGFLRVLVAP